MQGQRIMKKGKALHGIDDNIAELTAQASRQARNRCFIRSGQA